MIIYHPFRDANHCLYRIINLLYKNSNLITEDLIGFMDFYYLFPAQLKKIEQWPRKKSKLFTTISKIKDSYEYLENPRRVFFELTSIRRNALACLYSKGIVFIENEFLYIKENKIPSPLINTLENDCFRDSVEYKIITTELPKLSKKGSNSLKAKTNLMEYRYD